MLLFWGDLLARIRVSETPMGLRGVFFFFFCELLGLRHVAGIPRLWGMGSGFRILGLCWGFKGFRGMGLEQSK